VSEWWCCSGCPAPWEGVSLRFKRQGAGVGSDSEAFTCSTSISITSHHSIVARHDTWPFLPEIYLCGSSLGFSLV